MKVKVIIEAELDDEIWGYDEFFADMGDEKEADELFIDILQEDISEVLFNATWKLEKYYSNKVL